MDGILFQGDYNTNRLLVPLWCVSPTDGVTPATGEAAGQPQISKNGAAFVNTTNTLVAHDAAKGLYKLQLTANDVDTLGTLRLIYKSATTAVFDATFQVRPNDFLHDGTAQAGTSATITLSTGANGTNNNAYDNAVVWLVGGTGAGQMRGVSAYVASTKVVTVDSAWATTPDNSSVYFILPSPRPVASTDFADAFLGRNIAGGSSTGRTVGQALAALRNKVTLTAITGTTATLTVYGTDDTTVLWTGAVTLASGTNPLTGVDPA